MGGGIKIRNIIFFTCLIFDYIKASIKGIVLTINQLQRENREFHINL